MVLPQRHHVGRNMGVAAPLGLSEDHHEGGERPCMNSKEALPECYEPLRLLGLQSLTAPNPQVSWLSHYVCQLFLL